MTVTQCNEPSKQRYHHSSDSPYRCGDEDVIEQSGSGSWIDVDENQDGAGSDCESQDDVAGSDFESQNLPGDPGDPGDPDDPDDLGKSMTQKARVPHPDVRPDAISQPLEEHLHRVCA